MAKILIIDDDRSICKAMSSLVERMGHDATFTLTLTAGLDALTEDVDLVFLDVRMPDGSGLDILPLIRQHVSPPEVIVMTAFGDTAAAENAILNGAWDYIEKPSSLRSMSYAIFRALQYREGKKRDKKRKPLEMTGIIGSSPEMRECFELIARAAATNTNVLLTGETGTGKELFAHVIHENSMRSGGTFIAVDCAALPETLVESMLFGHEKGAFTGADRTQEGMVRLADKGTLFLDEAGEMPLHVQKAFLRVLQERRYRPVGSTKEVSSDFRLITATNRDLGKMVKEGKFRKDLLFRLSAFVIELPPLRRRPVDARDLLFHYTALLCSRNGIETKGFSPEFIEAFRDYEWPGNVRELINSLEYAIAVSGGEPILFPIHLPPGVRVSLTKKALQRDKIYQEKGEHLPLKEFRENCLAPLVTQYLLDLMQKTKGDMKLAADLSGLSKPRLYALLQKHQITH